MIMKMRKEIIFNICTVMYLKFDNVLLLIEQKNYLNKTPHFYFLSFVLNFSEDLVNTFSNLF